MLLECLLVLSIVAMLLYRSTRKPSNLPPGSFGWPVIGQLPPSNVPITQHFSNLRDKYGNIFTTKWGSRVVVALADMHLIRKALQHVDLQERPDYYSFRIFSKFKNIGVLFSSGNVWRENRRFLLRNLRDLGMGRTYLENSIHDEAKMLVEYLEKNNLNKPTELDWSINIAVLNVIWQMLASQRYEADDPVMRKFAAILNENVDIVQGPIFLLDVMPWLDKVTPKFLKNMVTKDDKMIDNRDAFFTMFRALMEEHKKTLDPECPRDLVDYYLIEMEANKNDSESIFTQDEDGLLNLLGTMRDFFAAGSETTSTTLRWMILYMANRPQIQERAQQVLDEVVPKDRLPSLDDRPQLAYIDALIYDVLRLSSLLPMGMPHCASATVHFEGYTIPKGAIVLGCLELCHRDPKYWQHPDDIYPQHFLDEEGNLDSKKQAFMPFSTGRRQCLGESLARMELFLFVAAILQRFVISPPPGVKLREDPDPAKKLLHQPRPFKVVLTKRI